MRANRYGFAWSTVLAIVLGVPVPHGHAQVFPEKPIHLIVPFGAGGITDIVARIVGEKLSASLRQPIIIDNRPGAGGNIGAAAAGRAPADGYTLFMATIGVLSVNAHLYDKLPYDPARDFAPITLATISPHLLVVPASLPVKGLAEFVALARSRPGDVSFSSAGYGSGPHLTLERFKLLTHTNVLHVPYKSGAEGVTAVVTGSVTGMFEAAPVFLALLSAGKIRALAVAAPKRLAVLPQVPTAADAGLPGFEAASWQGIVAPAKVRSDLISRLNSEIVRVLLSPEITERFNAIGIVGGANTPEEFARFIRSESDRWGEVIRRSGARID